MKTAVIVGGPFLAIFVLTLAISSKRPFRTRLAYALVFAATCVPAALFVWIVVIAWALENSGDVLHWLLELPDRAAAKVSGEHFDSDEVSAADHRSAVLRLDVMSRYGFTAAQVDAMDDASMAAMLALMRRS